MAVKKRSSRIANIHVQKEEEEKRKLEVARMREEMAVQKALAKKEKEREKRLLERKLQMQQALEQARQIERANRIQSMLRREVRMVGKLHLQWSGDGRSWPLDPDSLSFAPWRRKRTPPARPEPIDRDYVLVDDDRCHHSCENGTNKVSIYAPNPPRTRRAVPEPFTASHAQKQVEMWNKAAHILMKRFPSVRDDRLVKLKVKLAPGENPNLRIKMACFFAKQASFADVHNRGAAQGLWGLVNCPDREDPPLTEAYIRPPSSNM